MAQRNHNLPEAFLNRLKETVGSGIFQNIEKSFLERPTTFRLNSLKIFPGENIKTDLIEQGFKIRQVLWYKDAYILENKSLRELAETNAYKEGKIYVQSLASMAPVLALRPEPGEKVLDLTAAPGSKTSQIAALMERTGELVANDNNQIRWERLQHNMELLGVASDNQSWKFTLHNEDGWKIAEMYPNYFDKILLDAPCSAEARFVAGDSKTYGYWSEQKIKDMAYTQRKLLLSVWPALKPGGILVYSTCTFAPEENEVQIDRLLERYEDTKVEDIKIDGLKILRPLTSWKDKKFHLGVQKTVRILPSKEIEGFFLAKVRKN